MLSGFPIQSDATYRYYCDGLRVTAPGVRETVREINHTGIFEGSVRRLQTHFNAYSVTSHLWFLWSLE